MTGGPGGEEGARWRGQALGGWGRGRGGGDMLSGSESKAVPFSPLETSVWLCCIFSV